MYNEIKTTIKYENLTNEISNLISETNSILDRLESIFFDNCKDHFDELNSLGLDSDKLWRDTKILQRRFKLIRSEKGIFKLMNKDIDTSLDKGEINALIIKKLILGKLDQI